MSQPGYPSQFPQQRPNPYGQPPGPGHQPPGQGYPPGGGYPPPSGQSGDNPVGLIAMICGLLSLAMGCPLSIAAIILGYIGLKKEPKGMATAGLILGIVTLTLNVLVMCFVLAFYGLILGGVATAMAVAGPTLATDSAFQKEAKELDDYKTANGSYPDETEGTNMVAGTNDGWGNQIVYRREGEEYVLISPGADGVLDNDDDYPFYPWEYSPTRQPSDVVAEDYADISNPTEKSLIMAVDIIDIYYENSPSFSYPTDSEGQALIGHLNDEWGNSLVYRQTDGGVSYLVITKGPDGVLDTGDDLNDETWSYSDDY